MLTETAIRNAKPAENPYKLPDEKNLYVLVKPNGSKLFRQKYYRPGTKRENVLSHGQWPDVSLKRAREKRDEARKLLADGIDPAMQREAQKQASANTFESIGREWFERNRNTFAPNTLTKCVYQLEKLLYPALGHMPIKDITAPQILAAVRPLEARGKIESAHRMKQRAGEIIRYAVATGRAERDPTADLRGALAPLIVKNHAAIVEPKAIGELLRAIDSYQGQPAVGCAMRLAPLMFVRPGELRAAEWAEIDLERAEWRIAAHRMKMREAHLVPLSTQAVAILKEIEALTGSGRFVFPSLRTPARPMSENAITAALRRMGYSGAEMTWHGFRTMASTCLNEQGWHPDLIELQLAHAERNKVRAAYNKAQRLDERRKMMQAWANYLDGLKAGGKVVSIKERRA